MTTISPSPAPLTSPMRVPYAEMPRLMTLLTGDEKHWASATSTLDALWVLYDRILRVDPENPRAEDRDRMLLSKGHGPMAYYATLCARGFFDEDVLATFARYDSPLGGHPDRTLIPGVEISSGSLGHGLPLAVGMALGLRAKGNTTSRVYCLVGDAELDEGTNHEAIAAAARFGLDRLHVVVVDNQSASLGWPGGGIAARFQVEGWSAETVDGRDHVALERALTASDTGRPIATVAVVEKKS
jgi:transketolase